MKKVIFIAPFPNGRFAGGITSIAAALKAEPCQSIFHEQKINLTFFNSHEVYQLNASIGKFKYDNFVQLISFIKRLKAALKNNCYDIIHVNSSYKLGLLKDLLVIYLFFRSYSPKILFHIHFSGMEMTFLGPKLLIKFQIYILSTFCKVIVLSRGFKDELLKAGLIDCNIEVLYNFHCYNYISDKKLRSRCPPLNLLYLGSIDTRKGFLDLLAALDESDEIVLNVGGAFTNYFVKNESEKIIQAKRLKVVFHGFVKGLRKEKLFQESDVLVLPSYGEGFPMVIPESMAWGLAIISTKVGAIPEIIEPGKNGFLISPGDTVKLRKVLQELTDDLKKLKRISVNNIVKSKDFTINKFIHSLVEIYES